VTVDNYPVPALSLRWLYVDFNSYFASVEQQLRPELRGKPIAVVAVETDSTCAIAASYEAKAFGVKTGTMIHEAKRLCPGLTCVLARHECYVEFHHRLIEEIERHIDQKRDRKKYWPLPALLNRHRAESLSRKSRHRAAKAGWAGGAARGGFATEAFQSEAA
jgi:nucleotidyltransferase/DNA polymerase involved in DNA repair